MLCLYPNVEAKVHNMNNRSSQKALWGVCLCVYVCVSVSLSLSLDTSKPTDGEGGRKEGRMV